MAAAAPLVVVMGVSGSGKTTVGKLLARRLKAEFLEGDDLHPERNVERMAAGIPLTDNDRRAWLLAIAEQLADAHASQHALVVSCSALKRSYRDTLRAASNRLVFVHLHGEPALLDARLRARHGHYMPASLLTSQLETLEPPGADERAASFDGALPPEQLAEQAALWLSTPAPPAKGKR
jgi:carbohydrate kinase (thermoresistant glucokinase family)